jgi:hypothetical protein
MIAGLNPVTNGITLSLPTQAGVQYALEFKDSLDEPVWQPLSDIQGDGAVMMFTDSNPSPTSRFYRLRAP